MTTPTRSHQAPIQPGQILAGKYRVEDVIGRGGMGIVVSAHHVELHDHVAIKFLIDTPQEGAIVRFLREARTAAKVKSEHVCRVFDVGRLDSGEPYIVMDRLQGEDLKDRAARERPLPVALAVAWIIEACDALAEAHALGIVHRDLKPANLFLARRPDGSEVVKVLDFGISKVAGGTMADSGTVVGSPMYMSPEQVEAAPDVDARSDVWSLGVTLYELLSGQVPFDADSMIALAVKIREGEPRPLETTNSAVPKGLAAVVARCLEKDKADRWNSVQELVAALAPYAPPESASLIARLARTPASASSPHLLTSTPQPIARDNTLRLAVTPQPAMHPIRWPWVLGVGALLLSGGAFLLARTGSPVVHATPEPPVSSAVASAARVPLPLPLAPSTSATGAPVASAAPPPRLRPPTAAKPSGVAVVVTPPVVPSAAAPKGRHELDRDDPH